MPNLLTKVGSEGKELWAGGMSTHTFLRSEVVGRLLGRRRVQRLQGSEGVFSLEMIHSHGSKNKSIKRYTLKNLFSDIVPQSPSSSHRKPGFLHALPEKFYIRS